MSETHLDTGAAALHSLDQQESAEFTAHMETCESCRTEVDGFAEALARLGAGHAVLPPPGLRDRVLSAAKRTPQLPPIVPAAPTVSASTVPAVPEVPAVPSERSDSPAQRESRRRWFTRPATLLVAAAVVAGAVTGTVLLTNQPTTPSAADCVATASDRQVLAPSLGTGGDVQHAESCGAKAVVTVPDMPALPPGQVYQLWVMQGADARSVGMVGSDGAVMMADLAAGDTDIGISIEPGPDGSVKPTTDPLWVVTL